MMGRRKFSDDCQSAKLYLKELLSPNTFHVKLLSGMLVSSRHTISYDKVQFYIQILDTGFVGRNINMVHNYFLSIFCEMCVHVTRFKTWWVDGGSG